MAVRFLPAPEDRPASARAREAEDRGDLAEVIELRSRLPRVGNAWENSFEGDSASGPDSGGDTDDSARPHRGTATRSRRGSRSDASAVPALPAVSDAPTVSAVFAETMDRAEAEGRAEEGADKRASASEDGVRLLARRARSSGELRRELLQLGHDAHEVEAVIDEFVERLYLDDLGLARVLAEALRDRKRASRSQIRAKLRDRLLDPDAIEEAVGELDEGEEYELLRAAAADRARKMSGLDRQTAERRLLGYLARRGWSGERAARAAREALDGSGPRSGVRFQ